VSYVGKYCWGVLLAIVWLVSYAGEIGYSSAGPCMLADTSSVCTEIWIAEVTDRCSRAQTITGIDAC